MQALIITKIKANYLGTKWVILVLALAIRLVALAASNFLPSLQRFIFWGDASGYTQLAQNLLIQGSYHFNGGTATAFRMPGYPIFLALAYAQFGSPILVQLLQVIADLAVIFCTLLISEYLFGENVVSVLSMAVIAMNPVMILSTMTLYPESLGVLCTTAALLFLIRSRNSTANGLLVGAALAAAIYLKTNLFLVAILMLFIAGMKWYSIQGVRGFMKATFPPLLVIGLMLLPWVARNWFVMGHIIPLTTSNGDNFYRGNNPQANGDAVSEFPHILPGMTEIESSQKFSRLAWEWIEANPTDFMRLLPLKASRFMWPLALSTSGSFHVNVPVFFIILVSIVIFYLLAAAGAWTLYRRRLKWEMALLLAPFLSLLGLSLVSFGGIRFSIPAQPGLAVLFSAGFLSLLIRRNPTLLSDGFAQNAGLQDFRSN